MIWAINESEFENTGESIIFISSSRSNGLWSTESILSDGKRGFSTGIKRQGNEVYHLPPPHAVVKKSGSVYKMSNTSSWRSAYLVKHKENFIFYAFILGEIQTTEFTLINIFLTKKVVGLERGPLSLVSTAEELLDRKVAVPV
jgi:hypothetical protein